MRSVESGIGRRRRTRREKGDQRERREGQAERHAETLRPAHVLLTSPVYGGAMRTLVLAAGWLSLIVLVLPVRV